MTDATDGVVLHLWQTTQIVIDLALSACVALGLGSPPAYAAFRNVVVDAYADLDQRSVHDAATQGPGDLVAFLTALRDRLDKGT